MPATDTNLDEVRRAAENVQQVTGTWQESELTHEPAIKVLQAWKNGLQRLAAYALSTIPANPTAPIKAKWLREVWGAEEEYADDVVFWWMPIGHNDGVLNVERDSGRVYIHDAGSDRIVAELRHITTRHQFTQLATALGLTPKGDV